MTTARESLASQLHELMKAAATPEGQNKLVTLLDDFRVQGKPGTELAEGLTARESLGRHLGALWKKGPKDLERSVDALLDKYRMQLKKDGPPEPRAPKAAAVKPAGEAPPKAAPSSPSAVAPKVASNGKPAAAPAPKAAKAAAAPKGAAAKAAPAAPARRPGVTLPPPRQGGLVASQLQPRAAPHSVTPLFPNTPMGPSRRSECPKCKSRGVVLARSYTQEEFYTCIYCGWQAFKPFEESNENSPLAARLLAQRPATPAASKRKAMDGAEDDDDTGPRKTRSVIRDDDDGPANPWVKGLEGEDRSGRAPAVRPDEDVEDVRPARGSVISDDDAVDEDEDDLEDDALEGGDADEV